MTGPFAGRGSAWGLVLLVVALVFSEALLSTRVLYHRDLLGYWYPQMQVVRDLAAQGAWPWWNPFVAFGAPLFADPSFQLAYPPTWLVLLMPPASYLELYVVGHCWLAGVATRGLILRLGGSGSAATLGGLTFACSGPLLSSVSLYHHFAGAAWMPAVLWALLAALDAGTRGAAVRLAVVAAVQALAGSADLCVMTALAGLLLVVLGWPRPGLERLRGLARVAGVALPLAAALAAIQWLPALALAADGARPSLTPATNLHWSLHPSRLIEGIVPRLLSDLPLSSAARAALFESREPLLASVYLGVPAAVLAALGVASGASWGRRVGLGFVLFVLLALGRHAPVLPILLRVPPFGLFRYPEKYTLPASLFFAILVAAGADAWLRGWGARERRQGVAVALGALAVALALILLAGWAMVAPGDFDRLLAQAATQALPDAAGPSVRRLQLSGIAFLACAVLLYLRGRSGSAQATALAIGLGLVIDLVLAGRGVNPLAPATILTYRPPVLSTIGAEPGTLRVFSYPESNSWLQQQFTGEGWGGDRRVAWARGNLDRLGPPSAALFGVRGSFDGDFTGLANPNLHAMGVILRQYEATALGPRMLRMGNVGWVVGLAPEPFGLPEQASFPSVFRIPLRVFRVPDPLPPAHVLDGVHVAQEPRSFEVMATAAFDPRREAIVAGGAEERVPTPGFRGEARVASRRADHVVVDTQLSAPGLLVLVEAWGRGWSVEVDGKPAPLLRANVLFRGVALPAGQHRVSFGYFPPLLAAGATLSLGGALAGALMALRGRAVAKGVEAGEPPALGSGHRGELE